MLLFRLAASTRLLKSPLRRHLSRTQQATIGHVVAGRTVAELPLNGRNVFNLLAIAPGVVPQGQTAAADAATGQSGSGFGTGNYQISGGVPNTAADFIDGSHINTGYINAISYIPAQDSIREFRIRRKQHWGRIPVAPKTASLRW